MVGCLVECLVECLRTPTPAQPLMYKGSPKVLGGVLGVFNVIKKTHEARQLRESFL